MGGQRTKQGAGRKRKRAKGEGIVYSTVAVGGCLSARPIVKGKLRAEWASKRQVFVSKAAQMYLSRVSRSVSLALVVVTRAVSAFCAACPAKVAEQTSGAQQLYIYGYHALRAHLGREEQQLTVVGKGIRSEMAVFFGAGTAAMQYLVNNVMDLEKDAVQQALLEAATDLTRHLDGLPARYVRRQQRPRRPLSHRASLPPVT